MRRRRKKLYDAEPLALVLARDKIVKGMAVEQHAPVPQRDWEAAVGSRIAAKTRPIRIDRGVLYVATSSAAWAQELSLLSDAILEQLRRLSLDVRALRFKVSKVEGPARPPALEKRKMPPMLALPPDLATVVDAVAEPDLRDSIRRAAGRSLGWNAMVAEQDRVAVRGRSR